MEKDSIKQINKQFLIRVKVKNLKGSYLVGAGQYGNLVGCNDMANKHFTKVWTSGQDRTTIKLRRGLKIDFIGR